MDSEVYIASLFCYVILLEKLGNSTKKDLKKNDLTLKELSNKIGVNYQTLRSLTCKKTKTLTSNIASRIGS